MLDTWPITIPQLTGDEERNAYVYVPEGYDEDARFPVLYMFDGQNLFHDEDASFGRSWRMLDYFESNDIPVIIERFHNLDKEIDPKSTDLDNENGTPSWQRRQNPCSTRNGGDILAQRKDC